MQRRVTQKEIARKAEVDASTVSLALSGHPRIPRTTRERIIAIAEELGYRPDPALSTIATARWKGRRDAKGTTLAFLADDLQSAEIELKLYLDGVRQQADLLGYRVEPFSLSDYPTTDALRRVIRTRGIRGTVVGQSRQKLPDELFRNASTPVVQCGFLRAVDGEVVRPDLRVAVLELLATLRKTYQQITCVLPIEKSLHSDWIILGAVLSEARMMPRECIAPIITGPNPNGTDFSTHWNTPPEVIITINEKHKALLQQQADCPIYTLHTLPPFDGKLGVDLRLADIGRASVNLLEMKMRNLPMATAPYRQTLLIEPHII